MELQSMGKYEGKRILYCPIPQELQEGQMTFEL